MMRWLRLSEELRSRSGKWGNSHTRHEKMWTLQKFGHGCWKSVGRRDCGDKMGVSVEGEDFQQVEPPLTYHQCQHPSRKNNRSFPKPKQWELALSPLCL
mmetsp:Transcript_101136/g.185265  ORF Transcript_101136/g.185265 Transcript_101136/m.185265 type:complete len:99 (-) Transcript_101136:177-473(-)